MINRDTFKLIFRDHWEGFREENHEYAGEYYDGVIGKIGCGDVANGFMAYRCLHCGELKKVPFSCKSSFCLSCARVYTEQWVDVHIPTSDGRELKMSRYTQPEKQQQLLLAQLQLTLPLQAPPEIRAPQISCGEDLSDRLVEIKGLTEFSTRE